MDTNEDLYIRIEAVQISSETFDARCSNTLNNTVLPKIRM